MIVPMFLLEHKSIHRKKFHIKVAELENFLKHNKSDEYWITSYAKETNSNLYFFGQRVAIELKKLEEQNAVHPTEPENNCDGL